MHVSQQADTSLVFLILKLRVPCIHYWSLALSIRILNIFDCSRATTFSDRQCKTVVINNAADGAIVHNCPLPLIHIKCGVTACMQFVL